jgi:EcsC protein family
LIGLLDEVEAIDEQWVMSLLPLEKTFEYLVDWTMEFDHQAVQSYVEQIRLQNPGCDRRQIAQRIIDEQSNYNGVLGATIGFASTFNLPIMLPLDIIKAWKIQDFTIKSIAHVYGYTPHNTDLNTAVLLLLSNGSVEELKQFVITETTDLVTRSTFDAVDFFKTSAIQITAKEAPKYAAKAITKSGKTVISALGMKEASKAIANVLCNLCGKKVAEKLLEKSLIAVVPLIGAAIGGSMDWMTTQAVGNLAIEFFEHSGPEFLNNVFKNTVMVDG